MKIIVQTHNILFFCVIHLKLLAVGCICVCRWCCLRNRHNIEKLKLLSTKITTQNHMYSCEYSPPIQSHHLYRSKEVVHIIVRNGFYTICWNIFFGFSLSRFIYRKESWSIQTLWCQLWRRPCSPFGLYTFCSAVWVHNLWKLLPSIWASQGILEILQKLVWPTDSFSKLERHIWFLYGILSF